MPLDGQSGAWHMETLLLGYHLARYHGKRLYSYYSTSNGSKRFGKRITLRIFVGGKNGGHYETQRVE